VAALSAPAADFSGKPVTWLSSVFHMSYMTSAETAPMSTTPLRIALISETFPPEINGVANTLGRLSAGLLQLGHRVQVVRPRQSGDDGRHSNDELLLTRGWPLPGYPGLQWGQSCLHKLLRHWQRLRPDVLYIATEGPLGLAALRAARRLRIPTLSGFHATSSNTARTTAWAR
jgi:hypothetical protein